MDKKETKDDDENITFDIYHFFSRKDVILLIILILALLIYTLYHFFTDVGMVESFI